MKRLISWKMSRGICNIDIQMDSSEVLPQILSDSSQLQQVFFNILNNAIDAIGKNGEIIIRTDFSCQE